MGKGEVDIEIAAVPADVWAVVSNYGDLSFMPGVTSVRLEGDDRVVTAGGHEIRERLLQMDHDNMLLRYSASEGLRGVDTHQASIKVETSGDGSKVTYGWEVTPEEALDMMSTIYRGALGGLKSHFD